MTKTCNDKGGNDKKLHIFISFVIASVLGTLLAHIPPHNPWVVSACAFVLAMIVGGVVNNYTTGVIVVTSAYGILWLTLSVLLVVSY